MKRSHIKKQSRDGTAVPFMYAGEAGQQIQAARPKKAELQGMAAVLRSIIPFQEEQMRLR
ncbi:hypothetical protein [Sphingobacterium thalpophilum]|uniref:hypothetical protein n=1 Tax=Sphingobacterium thalpophilum TaxID=259 RepID=UPI0031D62001